MLMAGPSAAAISLVAIPLVVLATGAASISALAATAVEGVTAAFSSTATALGVANKVPFASKYRSKAIGAAKTQAAEAQKFAGQVMATLREKGGVHGVMEELKRRGGEPKMVELPEQPISVHDITGAEMAQVFDVKGKGPSGWKRKRWETLKKALEECCLTDRGWYAGRSVEGLHHLQWTGWAVLNMFAIAQRACSSSGRWSSSRASGERIPESAWRDADHIGDLSAQA